MKAVSNPTPIRIPTLSRRICRTRKLHTVIKYLYGENKIFLSPDHYLGKISGIDCNLANGFNVGAASLIRIN
jgi:hypothetical protein